MPAPFRVIAHRGASAHAPENTLAAFERAILLGAREVELDVRFSADERVIVFHDDSLDRKTSVSGRVRDYSADTLLRIDIGRWFDRTHPEVAERFEVCRLASLEQVFEALGRRVRYHVELKGWEDLLALRVMQEIDRFDLRDLVTVTSFSKRPLVQMRSLDREIPICFLLRDAADAIRTAEFRPGLAGLDASQVQEYWIDEAAQAGFQQVGIRAAEMRPRSLARAAGQGLEVRAWGVRDEADLIHVARLGAVGATVDWPDRALAILRQIERDSVAERRPTRAV